MREYAVLDYVFVLGGVSLTPNIELFSACIAPLSEEPQGKEVYLCDIEVLAVDLERVETALREMGATLRIDNAEPPNQTFAIYFSAITVPEIVVKLKQLFETEEMPFDHPAYWFRLDPDPTAPAELLIVDQSHDGGMLTILHNGSNIPDEAFVPLTTDQWREFGAALQAMTAGDDPVFTEVRVDEASIVAFLSQGAIANRTVHMLNIAYKLPTPHASH